MDASTQVRGFGVNVHRALVVLHATGEAPEWLARAAGMAAAAVTRLDTAAAALATRSR